MKLNKIRHYNIPKEILEEEHDPRTYGVINPFVNIRTIRERMKREKEERKRLREERRKDKK